MNKEKSPELFCLSEYCNRHLLNDNYQALYCIMEKALHNISFIFQVSKIVRNKSMPPLLDSSWYRYLEDRLRHTSQTPILAIQPA